MAERIKRTRNSDRPGVDVLTIIRGARSARFSVPNHRPKWLVVSRIEDAHVLSIQTGVVGSSRQPALAPERFLRALGRRACQRNFTQRGASMKRKTLAASLLAGVILAGISPAFSGQAPYGVSAPNFPVSSQDRVYTGDQFSNTVSVINPADNKTLGVIRLGAPSPANFSPLYKGQVLVHGMGFAPDHRTIGVVSIGSNSVTFIDTATNAVKHITYVGRSPHEAFWTPDGQEVWVTVRGENYVDVLDAKTFKEKSRIITPPGPGMTIFSPNGKYGYVCNSFNPVTDVVSVATHKIVATVKQVSPFCPNIAATPDGKQVWMTLKDSGKTQVFNANPPFNTLRVLNTGPITNHVNIVDNANGNFAYVTVGGLNEVKVFRTDDFRQVATIPVGALPHGLWPSGDGTRIYVGLENGDAVTAIDTLANKVIATMPIGQAPQALTYVPDAVPNGDGMQNLVPLGLAGEATHLALAASATATGPAPTSVTLFNQGLVQVLEAAVTGLAPKQPYVLALSTKPDGSGTLQPLTAFMTNPAGAAIVNAIGPIRQIMQGNAPASSQFLVILPGTPDKMGAPVQVQVVSPR
jgi:YVTN family beta-propeller protein